MYAYINLMNYTCIDSLTSQTVKKQPIIQITKYKHNIHSWCCLLTGSPYINEKLILYLRP